MYNQNKELWIYSTRALINKRMITWLSCDLSCHTSEYLEQGKGYQVWNTWYTCSMKRDVLAFFNCRYKKVACSKQFICRKQMICFCLQLKEVLYGVEMSCFIVQVCHIFLTWNSFSPIPYLDVIMNLYSIRSICNRHKWMAVEWLTTQL